MMEIVSANDTSEIEARQAAQDVTHGRRASVAQTHQPRSVSRLPLEPDTSPPIDDRAGATLPYSEATDLLECMRIMGEENAAYCRREVLGETSGSGPSALPIKTVRLNVTLLAGVTDTIARDVNRATRVFVPAALVITSAQRNLDPASTAAVLGADNALQTNPSGPGGVVQPSAEEQQLVTHNYQRGLINVYYVPRLVGRNDAGYTLHGLLADPIIVMDQSFNASATGIGTLEHEIGHALGLPHRGDAYQLMRDGLRAGNNLIASEIRTIRSSPYAR